MASSVKSRRMLRLFLLVFILELCCVPGVRGAEKKKLDREAEAKQAAEEEAKERKDREQGIKPQRTFCGIFKLLGESDSDNPEVIGTFLTDKDDVVPGQIYQVKVDADNKSILTEALKKQGGKKVTLQGILRNERKYLIVRDIMEDGPTPRARERSKATGI
jgi:hypothetical protein